MSTRGGEFLKPTVLDRVIKNFKEDFVGDYGVRMTPRKRPNFRELHWSSINVGWPPEGALHLSAVEAVRQVVAGTPGHPDQFPYVDSWLLIA